MFSGLKKDPLNAEGLESIIGNSLREDDVLIEEFLETIFIDGLESVNVEFTAPLQSVLRRYGTKRLEQSTQLQKIPSGPYYRQDGQLGQV